MCSLIAHRGPDDQGTWTDEAAAITLGHRRLSIIDLSPAGHQPMPSDDRSLVLSYNGEIYDYLRYRAELERDGIRFRSRTDTEVILRLYERYGLDALSRLNGMFALALWDGRQRRLLLARDHAGIKPLYYRVDGPRLYFASEIKALLAVPGLPREPNLSAVRSYLTFLWVPGDETMLDGVRKLEPGHYLLWEAGTITIRRWFTHRYEPDESVPEAEWVDRVRDTFIRTTRRQMVSDVPLGAFLSGGLDSSGIVASMRAAYPDRTIKAYTAQFPSGQIADEQGADDYPYAQQVARHLNVNLHSVPIDPDVIALLPRMVHHLDEPDADPAVFPSYLIAKAAREDGSTVLLSGTGGDEVFFGYRSHQAFRSYGALDRYPTGPAIAALRLATAAGAAVLGPQHRLVRRAGKFLRGLAAAPGVPRHLAVVDWSDAASRRALFDDTVAARASTEAGLTEVLDRYAGSFEGRGAINLHSHLLINTFLAAHNFLYTDKSSMAASVEVRVPFLDLELLRLAARIPERLLLKGGTSKYLFKKAMEPYLPREAIYRSKTGFGVPLRKWIREDLATVVQELLGAGSTAKRGLFAPAEVARVIADNAAGRADHAYLIYALLVLEVWMRTFIDRPGELVDFS